MQRPAGKGSRRGLSLLLEVIFGLGLFAASMLLVFAVFPTSHRAITSTKNLAVATDLAREFMEQELAKSYGTITDADPVAFPIPVTVNGVVTSTEFDPLVEVFAELPGAAPNDFARKRVVVTVGWVEGNGADRSVVLESYAIE